MGFELCREVHREEIVLDAPEARRPHDHGSRMGRKKVLFLGRKERNL
jgi:hypothetical protein